MSGAKMKEFVISTALKAHHAHWKNTHDASKGTKRANRVTREWQNQIQKKYPGRFKKEYEVAAPRGERIDVVDWNAGVAYELKASYNNPRHEFYHDIFKVIIARDNKFKKLRRFVFLTPKEGAKKLRQGMGEAVIKGASRLLRFKIEVVPL